MLVDIYNITYDSSQLQSIVIAKSMGFEMWILDSILSSRNAISRRVDQLHKHVLPVQTAPSDQIQDLASQSSLALKVEQSAVSVEENSILL